MKKFLKKIDEVFKRNYLIPLFIFQIAIMAILFALRIWFPKIGNWPFSWLGFATATGIMLLMSWLGKKPS